MSCSPTTHTIVCSEVFDENSLPSEEEIREYAVKIGIDPESEPHLLHLACDGLMQALPAGWKPCYDEELGVWYYFNFKTGHSQWEHPLDDIYRNLVKKSRSESVSSAGDEDSKTSAREDLKSFEEPVSSEMFPKTLDPLHSGLSTLQPRRTGVQLAPLRNVPKPVPSVTPVVIEEPASPLQTSKSEEKKDKFHNSKEKHPRAHREELTLTGGGASFLKKQPSDTSLTEESPSGAGDGPPKVEIVSSSDEPPPKGILRDRSPMKLWDVDPREMSSEEKQLWRKQELEEERKSVRFNLEDGLEIKFQVSDEEENEEEVEEEENEKPEDEDWNSEEEDPEEEKFISSSHSGLLLNVRDASELCLSDIIDKEKVEKSRFTVEQVPNRINVIVKSKEPQPAKIERIEVEKKLEESAKEETEKMEKELNETLAKHKQELQRQLQETKLKLEKEKEDNITRISKELLEEENKAKNSLKKQMEDRLQSLIVELKSEQQKQEAQIRKDMKSSLQKMETEMNALKQTKLGALQKEKEQLREKEEAEIQRTIEEEKANHQRLLEEKLGNLRRELESAEETELGNLRAEFTEALNIKKQEMKEEHLQLMKDLEVELKQAFEMEKDLKVQEVEAAKERNAELEKLKKELEEFLESKKLDLLKEHEKLLDSFKEEHEKNLRALKEEYKSQEEELKFEHEERLEKLKERLNSECENEMKKLKELIDKKNRYIEEEEKLAKQEMKKIEIENTRCEQLQRQVELLTQKLREGKKQLEDAKTIKADDRVFEKLRCEKRILEDKYRTLKEKYIKLKTDVKQTLEKRTKKREKSGNASETDKSTSQRAGQGSETEKSVTVDSSALSKSLNDKKKKKDLADKPQTAESNTESVSLSVMGVPNKLSSPKNLSSPPESVSNKDSVVSPQNTISTTTEERPKSIDAAESRRKKQFKMKSSSTSRLYKGRDTSPVENLRKQLKKLEDLEDLFPVSTHTDMYLRYPFTDSGQFGSSELEFFRHRIHLERDSVRRAKDFLRQQRQAFQSKQRELRQQQQELESSGSSHTNARAQLEQLKETLFQEEKDLSDMEVSLHRTRSLLGEKIIRLRHLEQSLRRATIGNNDKDRLPLEEGTLSDLSSHSGSSGFSSTEQGTDPTLGRPKRRDLQAGSYQESSEIIHSLEKLNSEIRGIWDVLNKQQGAGKIKTGSLNGELRRAFPAWSPVPARNYYNPHSLASRSYLSSPQTAFFCNRDYSSVFPVGSDSTARGLPDLFGDYNWRTVVRGPPPLLYPESCWPTLAAGQSLMIGPSLTEQIQAFRQHQQQAEANQQTSEASLAERTQILRDWLHQARLDSAELGAG